MRVVFSAAKLTTFAQKMRRAMGLMGFGEKVCAAKRHQEEMATDFMQTTKYRKKVNK